MYLIAFMGTLIRGFNFALLCHETIHPHRTRSQAKDAGKDLLPSSDASFFGKHLDCPASFVLVAIIETGAKGAGHGTREEA
jgi:hypothetical protein